MLPSFTLYMTQPAAPTTTSITWQCTPFQDLTPADLYAAMALRQKVFVLEQNCAYLDADGVDARAHHIFGWKKGDDWQRLIAYARIFPPRVKYAEASIGRVATHPDVRGTGVGQLLMTEGIRLIEERGWGREIRIAAQMYLERFYEGFGFKRVTEPFLEDDIWHVDMRRG
ncbi:MAG: GNAT family N-acetyltransferase [Gemmatimonadaceae bacterium]